MIDVTTKMVAMDIATAVYNDEQNGGCDLSAGLFGPEMSTLIRRYAHYQECQAILNGIGLILESNGYAHMTNAEGIQSIITELDQANAKIAELKSDNGWLRSPGMNGA